MEYIVVILIAGMLQMIMFFIWKKEGMLVWKKQEDDNREHGDLSRGGGKRQFLKKTVYLLVFAMTIGISCYLFHVNADKLNFCKLCLVYFLLFSVSLYDWKEHRIPNYILAVGVVVRCVLLIGEFFYHPGLMKAILISCIGGAFIFLAVLLLIAILTKHGFGMGDVKLFSVICFTIGLVPAYNLFFYSVLYTAVCSVFLLVVKKVGKGYKLPFAPFVLAGYVTIVCFQLY